MIVAPNDGMFTKVIAPIIRRWLPRTWVAEQNQTKKFIRLVNGSTIWWASGHNPLDLEGTSLQWAWLDEAKNYVNADVYNIMSARIGRDNRGGKLWITTTPIGLHHWLYKVFVEDRLPHVTFIKASTRDNTYAPTGYYERLASMYSGVYAKQQLEGDFVSFEGIVYDTFSVTENVSDVTYNPDYITYWAVDDGYVEGGGEGSAGYHPRVILICQRTPIGGVNVIGEYVATQELAEISIRNVIDQWGVPSVAYIDSSASELKARIHNLGIPTIGATHIVSEGIKTVRRYLLDGNGVRLLQINPACKTLIREFQLYRYASSSGLGEPKPIKQDDHALDALRYLLYKLY
jgi:phage terminase large subunit